VSTASIKLVLSLMLSLGCWSCSSEQTEEDDAGSEDRALSVDAGADAEVSVDAVEPDGATESFDASSDPCAPTCTSEQVCCVDGHGHFPRCVDGTECVPPLQRPS
jgi:hypothetical protein